MRSELILAKTLVFTETEDACVLEQGVVSGITEIAPREAVQDRAGAGDHMIHHAM